MIPASPQALEKLTIRQQQQLAEIAVRYFPEAAHRADGCLRACLEAYTLAQAAQVPPPVPEQGVEFTCLVCGHLKPWAVWERGVAVCKDCRDARFYKAAPVPSAPLPELRAQIEALPCAVWKQTLNGTDHTGLLEGELTSLFTPEPEERLVRLTDVLELVPTPPVADPPEGA